MGNIIALVNEKGGVAKTTTVKNIAAKLAAEGKRVLAVDLDPSANLTASLGYGGSSMEHSIYEIFNKAAESEAEEIPEGFAVLHNIEGDRPGSEPHRYVPHEGYHVTRLPQGAAAVGLYGAGHYPKWIG